MHLGEGPRPRKSFQTNMAYPCLYPSDNEGSEDDTLEDRIDFNIERKPDNDIVIPFSTEEAARILSESLEIKLSTKQLWYERDLFMITERGWKQQLENEPYDYAALNHDANSSKEEKVRFALCSELTNIIRAAFRALTSCFCLTANNGIKLDK